MKRLVVAVAATVLLAGCGSATSSTATTTGDPPFETVDGAKTSLVSITAAGGKVDTSATRLESAADLASFAAQFRSTAVRHRIDALVGDQLDSGSVYAAVVSIGCDRPPGADVMASGGAVTIVPHEIASPLPECLAAVTTVAVTVLPS